MKIKNLTKIYKTEYELVKALNDMTLEFPQKGLVFIVGVSGSGKSTLMNMLSGVDTPTSGEVIIGDKSVFGEKSLFAENKKELFGYRNSYVGLIFQDYNLIEDINVYDNIKLPLEFLGIEDYSIIDEVIRKVDIEEIKYSKVTEISSGQMQRVAIARALVKDSAMILADEPTGNLDSKNTKIVMDLLKEISKDRLVIVITHDDDAAHEYGDRIIAIEDGTILEDTLKNEEINVFDKELEKSTDFVKPKVSFLQQLKFTKGFMRNSIVRSISIFIMLILIPVIGNILCGYAFFDISTSYYDYQQEYGSKYVKVSNVKNGHDVCFSSEEYMEKIDLYGEENLYELYFTYIPITNGDLEESDFYEPVIKNMIIDNTNKVELIEGSFPNEILSKDVPQIAITDYVIESYKYYNGYILGIGDTLSIGLNDYEIVGIVKTNYKDFINADLSNQLTRLAFEENLTYFNAVYTSFSGYQYIKKNSAYFVEEANYTVYPEGPNAVPYVNTDYVLIRNADGKAGIPTYKKGCYGVVTSFNDDKLSYRHALISKTLWEGFMEMNEDMLKIHPSFTCVLTSSNKSNVSGYIAYVYDDSDLLNVYGVAGEIVVRQRQYESFLSKTEGSRFLFDIDSSIYKDVIENENIVNESFKYAKATWDKCEGSKFVMYEFLITLIVIMAIFAYIINSMTLNIEKKKIGIKYSFGISKFPIIIPYLLETILYIITGIVLSLVIVKYIYPFVVTNFIYTSMQELLEYEFFYIANMNILQWDLIIYAIMSISLVAMILTICRKSPIEIIKDL